MGRNTVLSSEIIEQASRVIGERGVSGRHTFYQLKHFVLGKELTTQAKMWKCLREIEARLTSAKSMVASIQEAEDDTRILEIKGEILEKKKSKSSLHREYKEIQRRKLDRKREGLMAAISEMKKRLAETEEEMGFFLGAYRQLEAIEPLRDHDDPQANADYWDQNFAQELQLRLMLQKPIDIELVKSILALGDNSQTKREMVGILDQIQRKAILDGKQSRIDHRSEKI
jgi:hypothetical protein